MAHYHTECFHHKKGRCFNFWKHPTSFFSSNTHWVSHNFFWFSCFLNCSTDDGTFHTNVPQHDAWGCWLESSVLLNHRCPFRKAKFYQFFTSGKNLLNMGLFWEFGSHAQLLTQLGPPFPVHTVHLILLNSIQRPYNMICLTYCRANHAPHIRYLLEQDFQRLWVSIVASGLVKKEWKWVLWGGRWTKCLGMHACMHAYTHNKNFFLPCRAGWQERNVMLSEAWGTLSISSTEREREPFEKELYENLQWGGTSQTVPQRMYRKVVCCCLHSHSRLQRVPQL